MLKTFKVVGSVIVILVAITQIWDWVTAPSAELKATVTYNNCVLPLIAREYLSQPFGRITSDSVCAIIWSAGVDSSCWSEVEAIERNVRAYERWSHLRDTGLSSQLMFIEEYWHVQVMNGEDQSLSSVVLSLPDAFLAEVRREGKQPVVSRINSLIEIGDMRPGESIEVDGWGDRGSLLTRGEKIQLTHQGGTGDVSVYRHTSPFFAWLSDNWLFLIAISMLPLYLLISLLQWRFGDVVIWSSKKSEGNGDSPALDDS